MTLFVALYAYSEAYLELCQTYKICLLANNCLRKTLHLRCLTDFEYWYFPCYFVASSTLDISNANILNGDISHVTLSTQIWNLETLRLWKLFLKFLLFVFAPSELDISNVDTSHIVLSPQIWNLETLKLSLQIFAVYLCPMNLTFQMVIFRMFMFSILFCHEVFLLSKPKCVVFKYEKGANCKFEKVSISNTKIRHF